MSSYSKVFSAFVTVLAALASAGFAQKQLQDNFWQEQQWTNNFTLLSSGQGYGIAVDRSNRCYIATSSALFCYDANGVLVTNVSFFGARDVFYDPVSNEVFACSTTGTNPIRVYNTNLTLLRQWGGSSLGTPAALAVDTNGLVYVTDTANNRILVHDRNGVLIRQWGQLGSAGGEFNKPYDITVGADGTIYVADSSNYRVQRFDSMGNFLNQKQCYACYNWNPKTVVGGPDGLVYMALYGNTVQMLDAILDQSFSFNYGTSASLQGATYSVDGQLLYVLTDKEVRVFRRGYRTMGLLTPNFIPLPVVYSSTQRPGAQWVDVEFAVNDADAAAVEVAAMAFLDGRKDLRAAVPMLTFEEGTGSALGSNIATGVQHHLTWNAGVDWPTNFGTVKIDILAKDERGLMDFHFLTIPSNSTYATELRISRSPVTQDDLLGLWTWLLARGNSSIVMQTGTLYGVSGVYSNVLLAFTQGTTTMTTDNGRNFLFELLNVREATSNEVYRAKVATTPGVVTRWDPRVRIGDLPQKVNEYGFDTGFLSANPAVHVTNVWWVVPLL